jgi:hypothetical protein
MIVTYNDGVLATKETVQHPDPQIYFRFLGPTIQYYYFSISSYKII